MESIKKYAIYIIIITTGIALLLKSIVDFCSYKEGEKDKVEEIKMDREKDYYIVERESEKSIDSDVIKTVTSDMVEDSIYQEYKVSESNIAILCNMLREQVTAGNPYRIISISRRLETIGDACVDELERLLYDNNPFIQLTAMNILVRIGTVGAISKAIERIVKADTADTNTKILIEEFSAVQSAEVVGILIKMLEETDNQTVKYNIKLLLASLEGNEVVRELVSAIIKADDPKARNEYLQILASLRRESNVKELMRILLESQERDIWYASAFAIANIATDDGCMLLAKLGNVRDERSEICIEALSHISSPYAERVLLDIVKNKSNTAEVRMAAVKALRNYTGENVLKELYTINLNEESPFLRGFIEESADVIAANIKNLRGKIKSGIKDAVEESQ